MRSGDQSATRPVTFGLHLLDDGAIGLKFPFHDVKILSNCWPARPTGTLDVREVAVRRADVSLQFPGLPVRRSKLVPSFRKSELNTFVFLGIAVVESTQPIAAGHRQVRMEFNYDGGGNGTGGDITLFVDGKEGGSPVSPDYGPTGNDSAALISPEERFRVATARQ